MSIKDNLIRIKSELPDTVELVAVSKTKPLADIMEAYRAGQRVFGENKVQEMVQKWEGLPKDIQWHMIGHLQRNKVKYMAGFVSLVHGVDSLRLLQEIDKQGKKVDRTIPCLLQVHIAQEETKFGLDPVELEELIQCKAFKTMNNIQIKGLMGMASHTGNEAQIRMEFQNLKSLFEDLKKDMPEISILSMGMSSDHALAVEQGSTMVRIGSRIFGSREQVQ